MLKYVVSKKNLCIFQELVLIPATSLSDPSASIPISVTSVGNSDDSQAHSGSFDELLLLFEIRIWFRKNLLNHYSIATNVIFKEKRTMYSLSFYEFF